MHLYLRLRPYKYWTQLVNSKKDRYQRRGPFTEAKGCGTVVRKLHDPSSLQRQPSGHSRGFNLLSNILVKVGRIETGQLIENEAPILKIGVTLANLWVSRKLLFEKTYPRIALRGLRICLRHLWTLQYKVKLTSLETFPGSSLVVLATSSSLSNARTI